MVFALAGAAFGGHLWLQVVCAGFATAGTALGLWQRRARPAVRVDDQGYAVLEHGREKLRVAWSEVKRVRAEAAEFACYVDCGDPKRNLLVPPERGWGFRFERSRELYTRIIDAVTDRVELVQKLEEPPK